MPSCSRCAKEGLVYVAITAPSSRQPSSCSECTKSNVRSSCDVRSVSDAECTFHVRSAAARLDSELSGTLDELRRSQAAEQEAAAAQQRALDARLLALACFLCLEKVRKKV